MNRDEVIALARKLYADGKGMSYNAIAMKFNTDGVPTVSGSGKWEHKMIKRLVSADVLKKAEVKVGMKSEREVQLESEVETLKSKLDSQRVYCENLFKENLSMTDKYNSLWHEYMNLRSEADAEKHNDVEKLNAEIELLNAVNAGLQSDRDEILERFNTVKQDYDTLKTQRDCFKVESERLQRQLAESELKYKTLYESEITRLGSELAKANQRIQELQDKQTFLKPESESGVPKNFNGWTIGKRSDGRGYNIYRKIAGKLHGLYIGKEWNADDARNKIAAFESKQKPQSELFAGSECRSCQHQPEFESRLRAVCPETIRTYRLDIVAKSFHDYDFSREMIVLAEEKRIELLAGDASQCDVSKLVQYRGRTYVNFEWR